MARRPHRWPVRGRAAAAVLVAIAASMAVARPAGAAVARTVAVSYSGTYSTSFVYNRSQPAIWQAASEPTWTAVAAIERALAARGVAAGALAALDPQGVRATARDAFARFAAA